MLTAIIFAIVFVAIAGLFVFCLREREARLELATHVAGFDARLISHEAATRAFIAHVRDEQRKINQTLPTTLKINTHEKENKSCSM